jgi:hypothetical protein
MSTCWKIYCVTESDWVFAWADTALTECPTNVAHVVRSTQRVRDAERILRMSIRSIIMSSTFIRVAYSLFSSLTVARVAKAIAYTTAGSFTIRLFDATNQQVLLEFTSSNTSDTTILELGTLSNVAASDYLLEVYVKATGGGSVTITEVGLYN